MKFKLRGRVNDLELGYVEDGIYHLSGLLADRDHTWKILEWINQELKEGNTIKVIKIKDWAFGPIRMRWVEKMK